MGSGVAKLSILNNLRGDKSQNPMSCDSDHSFRFFKL